MNHKPYTSVIIIPTGIGANIGGYAGDALPVVRGMTQVCDRIITHPNVMNGANLYWCDDKIYYVEGYALDQFASGNWGLIPTWQNKIGIIFDANIETELLYRHLQCVDAVRATLGVNVIEYIITDESMNVKLSMSDSGTSWGNIGNSNTLLRAGEKLIKDAGVNALAVVARFPDDIDQKALQSYRYGGGVDALAGVEAIISHLLVREFNIPCAHAPALSPLPLDANISPKAAAEELGFTFLPCVLMGLSRAPQYTNTPNCQQNFTIWGSDVDSVIIPASACGGSAILSFSHTNTLIIAVEDNHTVLNVFPESLHIPCLRVKSYLEAIGAIASHRSGVNMSALRGNIKTIQKLL